MRAYLQQRWFLILLLVLVTAGHGIGGASSDAASFIKGVFNADLRSWLVAGILFCMSVTLDGRRFRQAVLNPTPVLWAVLVNVGLIPLAASLCLPWQASPDFAVGLMIVASVPCTLAAASVWTRRAGGNDAVSLLVTLVTNAGCVLYTPVWLRWLAGEGAHLNVVEMMHTLLLTALVPTALGQVVRWLAPCAAWADRNKITLGVLAQLGVLSIVFASASDGGHRMTQGAELATTEHPAPGWAALAIIGVSCAGLHLSAMGVAWVGARGLRLDRGDAIAVAFAASQKTLPIGVLIATDPRLFGTEYPWAVFSMLIYHTLQLFIDTSIADRLAAAPPLTAPAARGGDTPQ